MLIVATPALRRTRLQGRNLQITVCGKTVAESQCEKILGVLMNNRLSWWSHMYGDNSDPTRKPFPGLVTTLSKRVGMLRRLSRLLPRDRLLMIANGIFMSTVLYCLQLFGAVWGVGTMQEDEPRHESFTKANLKILQTLQNKVMRTVTGHGFGTPIHQLLSDSGWLSIHQQIAYTTVLTVYKTLKTGEPVGLANRFGRLGAGLGGRNEVRVQGRLNVTREGLVYRGGLLWNMLPSTIRSEKSEPCFKKQVKAWIKENVAETI